MVTKRIISFHIFSSLSLSLIPHFLFRLVTLCLSYPSQNISTLCLGGSLKIIRPSFAWIKQSIYICFRLSYFPNTCDHRQAVIQKTFLSTLRNHWSFNFFSSFLSFVGVISFISLFAFHSSPSTSMISISNWSCEMKLKRSISWFFSETRRDRVDEI